MSGFRGLSNFPNVLDKTGDLNAKIDAAGTMIVRNQDGWEVVRINPKSEFDITSALIRARNTGYEQAKQELRDLLGIPRT